MFQLSTSFVFSRDFTGISSRKRMNVRNAGYFCLVFLRVYTSYVHVKSDNDCCHFHIIFTTQTSQPFVNASYCFHLPTYAWKDWQKARVLCFSCSVVERELRTFVVYWSFTTLVSSFFSLNFILSKYSEKIYIRNRNREMYNFEFVQNTLSWKEHFRNLVQNFENNKKLLVSLIHKEESCI